MNYDYYAFFMFPNNMTMDNPAGILRARKGSRDFEAMHRDNKWYPSDYINEKITKGDLDFKKINREQAKSLLKKFDGVDDKMADAMLDDTTET